MASKLPLLLLLIALTCLSQLFRVSNSVIAPELMRDLHLDARQFGWAGSAFFLALFAVQLPVGLWFDRFGARRTVTVVSLLSAVGSVWIACAADAADLITGRIIVGLGCAASFMSVVFLCARWFEPARLATGLSWVFAASNIGTLAGATPLAWVAATAGLLPLLSMHFFAYATMLTVLGIWGGPYLFDIHKLGGVQRGNVLLAMGVAQTLGILAYGPMDRVLGSRKKVVFGGALISAFFLGALALVSQPPLWLAVMLLIAACFFCAFGTVIVAQGRTLFPDRLGGRAVTTVNLAQCLGLTVLPAVTGYIVEALGATDLAYRTVFATLAGGLLLGLIPYSRSPDNASR